MRHNPIMHETTEWNGFPTTTYLTNNYGVLHEEDMRIMQLTADFYKSINPIDSVIDVGTGPNLYPALTLLPFAKKITLTDISESNLKFLREQTVSPSHIWSQYWRMLMKHDRAYRSGLYPQKLQTVAVRKHNILTATSRRYTLATSHFCLEAISNQIDVFMNACKRFTELVHPDGYLVAVFMENSTHYFVDGVRYPTITVNQTLLLQIFGRLTKNINIVRIPRSKKPIRSGYSGILLLTAQRK